MSLSPSPRYPHAASSGQFVAFINAYVELCIAHWECVVDGRSPREKALSLAELHEWHVGEEILLWMLFRGHVEHLRFPSPRRGGGQGEGTDFPSPLRGRGQGEGTDFPSPLRGRGQGEGADIPSPLRGRGQGEGADFPSPLRGRGQGEGVNLPQPAESLILTDESCFALTDKGAAFAEPFLADALKPETEGALQAAWHQLMVGQLTPAFDRDDRIFAWGEHLLKRFRQPAVNQELILAAAEELEWPEWFDDPLPLRRGRNPKSVLNDTIADLNRRQIEQLVHFKGDGSGRRVGWELR